MSARSADIPAPAPITPIGPPCIHCGRNLADADPQGNCPDCGTPTHLSLPGLSAQPGRPGLFAAERSCIGCGYDLAGLPADGICPECATPVRRSIQGFFLVFASRSYLRNLHLGLHLMIAGHLLMAVLWVLQILLPRSGMHDVLAAVRPISAALLLSAGHWLLASFDPGFGGGERPHTARWWIQVTAIVILTIATVMSAIRLAPFVNPLIRIPLGANSALGLADVAASCIQFFAVIIYCRRLSRRIPSRMLADQAATNLWLLPLIAVAGLLLVVGPVVAWVLYLVFLNSLRRRLAMILRVSTADDWT